MRKVLLVLMVVGVSLAVVWELRQAPPAIAADPQPEAARRKTEVDDLASVEDDMHEFMEYVFEPTFKRLKSALAAEPADKAGWKAIKSDSLILAEAGNLLLTRVPEQDANVWRKASVEVRSDGEMLYNAAKSRDYMMARRGYEIMIAKCNSCHRHFANGEHQLEP